MFLRFLFPLVLAAAPAGAAGIERGVSVAAMGMAGAAACASCHGAQGQGMTGAGVYPVLAGQGKDYLAKQLRDFRDGRRKDAVMGPIAKALDDAAIDSLALFYSKLSARAHAPRRQGEAAELVRHGDWGRELPPCASCHGQAGEGIPPHFPRIAGQLRGYTEKQLKDWKAGKRANDPQGLMKSVAEKLDEAQIAALAAYFEARGKNRP